MALRARLTPPQPTRTYWPWHKANTSSLSVSLLVSGDRRMEAENYLARGFRTRLAIESKNTGWVRLQDLACVWQPSRLKGIQVSPEFGTPFLAATQVFDLRPSPRKWLSLERTDDYANRFVSPQTILLTCSGNVGHVTLARKTIEGVLISHDLLRIEPNDLQWWGWAYAYLRAPVVREMMKSAQYGHIIKHLEVSHVNDIPIPLVDKDRRDGFNRDAIQVYEYREQAHDLILKAEQLFAQNVGSIRPQEDANHGYTVMASNSFVHGRRRLDASYHSPFVREILGQFKKQKIETVPLNHVCERVYWISRFKRVFGDAGVPYLSADELFSLNLPTTKRVLVEQADDPERFFVKAGWILMACSGQVYGLNGNVVLATRDHEGCFFSHDLVRIVPKTSEIRSGYLYIVLGHPELGRPLVIRNAYGSSIPHLEPTDIESIPIARLGKKLEDQIAELAEEAVKLRSQADSIENDIALRAEGILRSFISH